MASNYTEHYDLCQWETTDQVQRTDFNADNAKIDAALAAKADSTDLTGVSEAVSGLSSVVAQHAAALSKLGNCRIEILTYTGTGTYGSDSPSTLTFSALPKFVLIAGIRAIAFIRGGTVSNTQVTSGSGNFSASMSSLTVSWSGTTMSYYGSHEIAQLNNAGSTYWVMALYAEDM